MEVTAHSCHSSQEVLSFNQVHAYKLYIQCILYTCVWYRLITSNTLIVYLETVTRKLHGMYCIHQQGKFRNHNNYYRNCNLSTCTNYRLDLSKYVIGCHPGNAIYELYGVINHYGMLYAGHCEVYSYHLLNKTNIYLPQTLLLWKKVMIGIAVTTAFVMRCHHGMYMRWWLI